MALTPVAEALRRIVADATPAGQEAVTLDEADGRILAVSLAARRDQPPADMSAMDGYAIRHASLSSLPATLHVIDEAAAGHAANRIVGEMQAIRIFTGAPLPEGTDTIVIQENCTREGDTIIIDEPQPAGRHIRRRGIDFHAGQTLLPAGRRLGPRDLSLAAAMGHGTVACRPRPRVAIFSTGDELVRAGEEAGPSQIVASNAYGIAALVRRAGGQVIDLGIVRDSPEALAQAIESSRRAEADVLVTLGGASVGDHDLVGPALIAAGAEMDFWKIAMRPGKPLMSARLGAMRILGLPGNPVSALVCARIFLLPLVAALSGIDATGYSRRHKAFLGHELPENDQREDYMRATLAAGESGFVATAFSSQDSSMLSTLASADILIVRPPFAPSAAAGTTCEFIYLDIFAGSPNP
ncbi:MAG: gephyrin-like molybdotransferase Glp [Flavobacteriaceae bacterium]